MTWIAFLAELYNIGFNRSTSLVFAISSIHMPNDKGKILATSRSEMAVSRTRIDSITDGRTGLNAGLRNSDVMSY